MATIRLAPPEQFDFKRPDDWSRWKRRFELYRSASALDKEEEARQVSALLYCMGETAGDVLTSTNIATEDRGKYEVVMKKFDEFFKVRRNVIFERAKFNGRNQGTDESAEEYITALYSLVETCDYKADVVEEMLRDRIVVGMKDKALSERLQLDPDLTLDKAKKTMRQKEAVKEQRQQLQHESGPHACPLDAMTSQRDNADNYKDAGVRPQHSRRSQKSSLCTRCGRGPHPTGVRCPARAATCRKCNRRGHYEAQCFSKTVAPASEVTVDTAFLGAVSEKQNSSWQMSICVRDKLVPFKLDTGAQVTAISDSTYRRLQFGPLKKPSKRLYGPARQSLDAMGQFTATLSHGSRSSKQTVFVV